MRNSSPKTSRSAAGSELLDLAAPSLAPPRLVSPHPLPSRPSSRGPDVDHLLGEIPLVRGRGHVQPLVALEPHQGLAQRARHSPGQLGLADPRLALQEQGTAQLECQKERGPQTRVRDVALAAKQRHCIIDGPRKGRRTALPPSTERGEGAGALASARPRALSFLPICRFAGLR